MTIAQQLNIKEFPFQIKDKNGEIIYWENSKGYWIKWEYDIQGNKIYNVSSSGFWEKYERDAQGNTIYHENSEGKIVDNRPKQEEYPIDELKLTKYSHVVILSKDGILLTSAHDALLTHGFQSDKSWNAIYNPLRDSSSFALKVYSKDFPMAYHNHECHSSGMLTIHLTKENFVESIIKVLKVFKK